MQKYNKLFFLDREEMSIQNTNTEKNLVSILPKQRLAGIKFSLKGRIKGVRRARKISFNKGMIKAQTYHFFAPSHGNSVQTKWGKQGLSITLGYH